MIDVGVLPVSPRGTKRSLTSTSASVLRARVFEITAAAGQHVERGVPLGTLMGSDPDAMKLVSCLTLFRELDPEFARLADPILSAARK